MPIIYIFWWYSWICKGVHVIFPIFNQLLMHFGKKTYREH